MRGKRSRWWVLPTVAGAIGLGYLLVGVDVRPHVEYVEEPPAPEEDSIPLPPQAYGIPLDGFVVEPGVVHRGATFGALLGAHDVGSAVVHALAHKAMEQFDVRRMRSGHPYAFIFADDESCTPSYFVYENGPVEYVVFGLHPDSLTVRTGRRPVRTTEHVITATVTGALYNDIQRAGADPMLALQLAEVFAWTVDFHRIQKGDAFTVVFTRQEVDGQVFGMPQVLAARYVSDGRARNAYRHAHTGGAQYFDEEGNSLRKAFLKAPVKYSRISSGFSARRLHPVQKVMKAHLGTDYAAPYGTPILAVGDGVVERTGFTRGNGNYVKVRHNGTYTTQYLHMRKILVKQGQRVAQGDVIGEVGSTGLATGPHVCFRFWKHGVQVDHRKEEFPSAEPVPAAERAAFDRLRQEMDIKLGQAVPADMPV